PANFEETPLARAECLRLLDAGEERAQVVVRLKAHQVVLTQIPDQVSVVRQHAQHLPVRKRNVQEEANGAAETLLAQIASQRDELIVMHPDRIVRLQKLRELAGELRLHGVV